MIDQNSRDTTITRRIYHEAARKVDEFVGLDEALLLSFPFVGPNSTSPKLRKTDFSLRKHDYAVCRGMGEVLFTEKEGRKTGDMRPELARND